MISAGDCRWPPVEDLEPENLVRLPEGYGYELHEGNLVVIPPPTFRHQETARRLLVMLHSAGLDAFQSAGVLGDRPRDCRTADVGVIRHLTPDMLPLCHVPGAAFSLVVEVVAENAHHGEYTDKMAWYAERRIPEYWIVDRSGDEPVVLVQRLTTLAGRPTYTYDRTLPLPTLENEYEDRRLP